MGNINLIRDDYNSNPVGAKAALDMLKLMPGKRVIVTPGMIELGSREYELNLELGRQIAKVCDEVILVNGEGSINETAGKAAKQMFLDAQKDGIGTYKISRFCKIFNTPFRRFPSFFFPWKRIGASSGKYGVRMAFPVDF